jgi:hypothetical protein
MRFKESCLNELRFSVITPLNLKLHPRRPRGFHLVPQADQSTFSNCFHDEPIHNIPGLDFPPSSLILPHTNTPGELVQPKAKFP